MRRCRSAGLDRPEGDKRWMSIRLVRIHGGKAMATHSQPWHPFRPTPTDLARISDDVAEIPVIQQKTCDTISDLRFPDRVARRYQIAGSKVIFRVAESLPAPLQGVGLYRPGSEHIGIGRISTCLGIPHSESLPDFLGIMAAFQS